MKTENEIINDSIETTTIINEKNPELSKYKEEMPVTLPNENDPEINETNLKEYQSSLNVLLNKYAANYNRLTK